jgi:hypothetical protein
MIEALKAPSRQRLKKYSKADKTLPKKELRGFNRNQKMENEPM